MLLLQCLSGMWRKSKLLLQCLSGTWRKSRLILQCLSGMWRKSKLILYPVCMRVVLHMTYIHTYIHTGCTTSTSQCGTRRSILASSSSQKSLMYSILCTQLSYERTSSQLSRIDTVSTNEHTTTRLVCIRARRVLTLVYHGYYYYCTLCIATREYYSQIVLVSMHSVYGYFQLYFA